MPLESQAQWRQAMQQLGEAGPRLHVGYPGAGWQLGCNGSHNHSVSTRQCIGRAAGSPLAGTPQSKGVRNPSPGGAAAVQFGTKAPPNRLMTTLTGHSIRSLSDRDHFLAHQVAAVARGDLLGRPNTHQLPVHKDAQPVAQHLGSRVQTLGSSCMRMHGQDRTQPVCRSQRAAASIQNMCCLSCRRSTGSAQQHVSQN